MIRLLSFCMCILSLLGAFVFGAAKVPCLLAAAVSAAVFVFAGKLMRKKLFALLITVGFAIVLLGAMTIDLGVTEGGVTDYNQHLAKFEKNLTKGKLDQAAEEMEYLEQHFQPTDTFRNLKMVYYLASGSNEEAIGAVYDFDNTKCPGYFEAMEACMLADRESYSDDDFCRFYRAAADANPDWAYANRKAGLCYARQNEYQQAEYYLRVAYDCAEMDYEVPFYLGIICCEQGRVREGKVFFEDSDRLGAPDDYVEIMAMYLAGYN